MKAALPTGEEQRRGALMMVAEVQKAEGQMKALVVALLMALSFVKQGELVALEVSMPGHNCQGRRQPQCLCGPSTTLRHLFL
jgi:hypothetical protein